jgi:hypothetical protein
MRLVWGVPAAVLVHNVEEALTMARYAPSVLALVAGPTRWLIPILDYMYVVLAVVTAIPIALALLARGRASSSWGTYGLLLVAAVVLVNVVWHLVAAATLGGYAPGLLTAVAVNLPVMVAALRWARREGWLSKGALGLYLAVGFMLHGAGLLAVLALATFVR